MKHFILFLLLSTCGIAQTTHNISVVSAEKLNVVYRGVPNPIKIAVPGAKSFKATAPGLKALDSIGNYTLSAGQGNEVSVQIEAVMEDGNVLKEEKVFRIKGFPSFTGIIHGMRNCGNYTCIKEELSNMQVDVILEEVLLYEPNIDYGVKEFTVSHISKKKKQQTIVVKGNRFSPEILSHLGKIRTGSMLIIDNIKTWNNVFQGFTRRPSPIVIEIVD